MGWRKVDLTSKTLGPTGPFLFGAVFTFGVREKGKETFAENSEIWG